MKIGDKVKFNNMEQTIWSNDYVRTMFAEKVNKTGVVKNIDEDEAYFVRFDDGVILYLFSDEIEQVVENV